MISVSPFVMSVMTLIIGIVMLLLGINLTKISPKLSAVSLTLPTGKLFARKETDMIDTKPKTESGKRWKLLISGGLTFFLPCGFTFAMQMYAIGTGNFWMGMAVMALFAIGTLPGLLSIGSLTSIFQGKQAKIAYQAIGVLVVLFGLFNISNAYGVLKHKLPSAPQAVVQDQTVTTIDMVYGENALTPTVLNLELGKRYKIVVDVQVDIYSCLNTLYIPGLDEYYKTLKKGEKVEFTFDAVKAGTYPFVCATMGMSQGSKIVIK
ncbi:MAG: sulfite exporter TauE/SafE family protein [bacterium]